LQKISATKKKDAFNQWHSEEFSMGGWGGAGGLGADPPAAGGKGAWGSAPSAGRFLQFVN